MASVTQSGRPLAKWLASIAELLYSLPMEDRTEIPPGTLYMLILKTLMRVGPMHGYGIAQHIQRISENVLHVEEGSLYPALQRMLIKGWLVAEWKQSENNRRARFYRLTPAGRKQLAAEMAEFERVMGAITRVIQPA
jgi:PadR family transcriptional regulator PadR